MSQMTLNSSIVVASLTVVGRTVSEVPEGWQGMSQTDSELLHCGGITDCCWKDGL